MTRIRLGLGLAAALALSAPAAAQPVGAPQNITVVDSGTACVTAPTACATYALDNQTGGLTLGVSGTWTGTLTFEGTNNDGTWTAVLVTNLATGAQASTTTASGLFSLTNAGVIKVRVRATAAITGTATITAAKGLGFARLFGPSPTFTTVLLGDGTAAAPSLASASQTNRGLFFPATDYVGFAAAGVNVASVHYDSATVLGIRLRSDAGFSWSSTTNTTASSDVNLFRDAANTLAQRNTTNAQTFRVYNTTDGTNKEYVEFLYNANVAYFRTAQAGTGTYRNLIVGTNGGNATTSFMTNGTVRWAIDGTNGGLTGNQPLGGLGYTTGAGGAITQLTSRTTGVTLNTVTGDITLFSAAGSATAASFTVTNSAVAATDNIVINQKSGTNLYQTLVTTVAAGSFVVTFFTTGGVATDSPVFHFSVIKGASS